MATVSITWHSMQDARVCKVCETINGYTWIFEVGKAMIPDELLHPAFPFPVWKKGLGSKAHGHTTINCRCHISIQTDFHDVFERIRKYVSLIEASVS